MKVFVVKLGTSVSVGSLKTNRTPSALSVALIRPTLAPSLYAKSDNSTRRRYIKYIPIRSPKILFDASDIFDVFPCRAVVASYAHIAYIKRDENINAIYLIAPVILPKKITKGIARNIIAESRNSDRVVN